MKSPGLIFTLIILCCGSMLAAERPNVLVMLGDDLGYNQKSSGVQTGSIDHRDSGGNNYTSTELQRFALRDTAPNAPRPALRSDN